jgi:hypothetical protein
MIERSVSPRCGAGSKGVDRRGFINWSSVLLVLVVPVLISCTSMGTGKTSEGAALREDVAKAEDEGPKPGAVKITNGVEYIYARNVRWMKAPYEPEYAWVRKDQYSPGFFESLKQSSGERDNEFQELKKRIQKLENELERTKAQP